MPRLNALAVGPAVRIVVLKQSQSVGISADYLGDAATLSDCRSILYEQAPMP